MLILWPKMDIDNELRTLWDYLNDAQKERLKKLGVSP